MKIIRVVFKEPITNGVNGRVSLEYSTPEYEITTNNFFPLITIKHPHGYPVAIPLTNVSWFIYDEEDRRAPRKQAPRVEAAKEEESSSDTRETTKPPKRGASTKSSKGTRKAKKKPA